MFYYDASTLVFYPSSRVLDARLRVNIAPGNVKSAMILVLLLTGLVCAAWSIACPTRLIQLHDFHNLEAFNHCSSQHATTQKQLEHPPSGIHNMRGRTKDNKSIACLKSFKISY